MSEAIADEETIAPAEGATAAEVRHRRRESEIVAAAARIFHEKGYGATSIQDVAEAVGILKGSLYYYIDSKEDLLFAVVEKVHRLGLAFLDEWRRLDVDPLTRLRIVVEGHVRNNLENWTSVGVFFHDFRSLGPERRAEIVGYRDVYDRFLRELIVEAQDAGVLDPEVDPKIATIAILGMLNWVYQWYRPDGPLSPDAIAAEFADLVLSGLVGPASGSRHDLGREATRDA